MKRKLILYILGVLIFILSIIGLTYAFMKPKVEEKQSTNISIKACAKVQLKDSNSQAIDLKNTYPMDDSKGLETNPYEFTISSTCEDYVGFNLYLTSLNDNQIEDNNIHFAITSKSKEVLSEGILASQEKGEADFNSEELKELNAGIKGTAKNIYKVYSNNIPLQGESIYQLYLWVDKDANNETMGQSFKAGLSVKSYNRKETFAEYLIKNKDNTLIYHDGVCDYKGEANCDLEAEDLNYRYAGGNDVVHNYICFGGECSYNSNDSGYKYLYRIIGLFKNSLNLYELKLIKADFVTTEELGTNGEYQSLYDQPNKYYLGDKNNYFLSIAGYSWNSKTKTNKWQESELNTINLNDNFLNQFLGQGQNININPNEWQQMISKHRWIVGGNSADKIGNSKPKDSFENEIINPQYDLYYDAYIGLPYVADYGYATISSNWSEYILNAYMSIKLSDWMYIGLYEYTITPWTGTTSGIFHINAMGHLGWVPSYKISDDNLWGLSGVRPSFYLVSSIKRSKGDGTKENPYRVSLNF